MELTFFQRNYRKLMRRLRPCLFLSMVYARDLEDDEVKNPPAGFTARFLSEAELLELCDDPELKLTAEFVESAFAREDVCTGMFHDEKLVAYMWRSTSIAPHTADVLVETHKPYRYGYKALTLREYRGQHIPEYLAPISSRYYVERGYKQSIGFVETHNFPSRRSEVRRGSYLVGYAGYISLLKMRITFRTKGVARTGFGFVSDRAVKNESNVRRSTEH